MTLLTHSDTVQVWHIIRLGFLGSFVDVFNWPARSALIPRLVPPGLMMNAVTINAMIIQLSFLVGPAVGGVLIDHTGLTVTYLISTIALLPRHHRHSLATRPPVNRKAQSARSAFSSMVEGVEFIWIQRIILSLFLLDFGVTLVGFYRPILPIFAADVFNMGASGLGLLYAAPSARFPHRFSHALDGRGHQTQRCRRGDGRCRFCGKSRFVGRFKVVLDGGGGGDPPRRYRFGAALPSGAR